MARKTVTVALSADGGDEIFAGYPKYFNALKRIKGLSLPGVSLLANLVPAGGHAISQQNKRSKFKDYFESRDEVKKFDIITQAMTYYETQQLLTLDIKNLRTPFDEGSLLNLSNDTLSKFQATEYKTYMVDDILQKVDRATMCTSLEGREPFLDHRLVEFAATLPTEYKYRNGVGKAILKDIVHQYVPASIMQRPKMGFGVPLSKWLKNELKDTLTDVISESHLKDQQIFKPSQALQIRDAFLSGRQVEDERLQYLFLFQLWYNKWMK